MGHLRRPRAKTVTLAGGMRRTRALYAGGNCQSAVTAAARELITTTAAATCIARNVEGPRTMFTIQAAHTMTTTTKCVTANPEAAVDWRALGVSVYAPYLRRSASMKARRGCSSS